MKKSIYEEKYTSSQNADYLHIKRMEVYQAYNMAKLRNPDEFTMSILEFMEKKYQNEKELIELEKIRVAENEKIFIEWQNSGDNRSFQQYASQEYGFNDSDDLSQENISKTK